MGLGVPGPPVSLPDPEIGKAGYRDISVEVGIPSTPVVSVEGGIIYAVAATKDAADYITSSTPWIWQRGRHGFNRRRSVRKGS